MRCAVPPYGYLIPVTSAHAVPIRSKSARSHRVGAALAGADPHRLLDRDHEDLAVADLVGLGGLLDRLDGACGESLLDDDLDFDLGQEVDQVFGAAIDFGVALLPAEAPDLADGHTGDA